MKLSKKYISKIIFTVIFIMNLFIVFLSWSEGDSKKGLISWPDLETIQTIRVKGTFDGKGQTYTFTIASNALDGSPVLFILEEGATLKNVVIQGNTENGIFVAGNNTIENVTFLNVRYIAISMNYNTPGGPITIKNCVFQNIRENAFAVSRASTWNIINCTFEGGYNILRQSGGRRFPLSVNIKNLKATDLKNAIVRSDSPRCKVTFMNISTDLAPDKWWIGKLKVNAIDSKTQEIRKK